MGYSGDILLRLTTEIKFKKYIYIVYLLGICCCGPSAREYLRVCGIHGLFGKAPFSVRQPYQRSGHPCRCARGR